MQRVGSSTGKGAGWPVRFADSAGMCQTSRVQAMKSSLDMVALQGRPTSWRFLAEMARSKRPFEATMIRSVRSRKVGFDGFMNDPQAQLPDAPAAFDHTTTPRSPARQSSSRIRMTSEERERYGFRPRPAATLTAMRPPGSRTRKHSTNTSRSMAR